MAVKKNKYNRVKKEVDGVMYDSTKEANYAIELNTKLEDGLIFNLQRQVPIRCEINGKLICKLILDFVYDLADGTTIYCDVKGMVLPVFKLKQKLVKALHGIDIQIV